MSGVANLARPVHFLRKDDAIGFKFLSTQVTGKVAIIIATKLKVNKLQSNTFSVSASF